MSKRVVRLRLKILLLGSCLLAAGVRSGAIAQEVSTIQSSPSCARCQISGHLIATLGVEDSAQSEIPKGLWKVNRIGRFYWGVPWNTSNGPVLFDSLDRFVRTLGKVGSGPGEFRRIKTIRKWLGDSILIYDFGLARASIVSASLRIERQMSLPMLTGAFNVVPLANGTMAINAIIASALAAGFPLHIFDQSGRKLLSFGSTRPTLVPNRERFLNRHIALSRGLIWSVPTEFEYVVEAWDPGSGQRRFVIRRNAAFYPSYESAKVVTPLSPPSPNISGVWVDERERLWVVVAVPDSNWARGLSSKTTRAEHGTPYRIEDEHKVYDSIIEVFDTRTGKLLASRRFDKAFWAYDSDGGAIARVERADGAALTEVWRFDVTGTPP